MAGIREFGPEIAVPLKEAIAQTEGLSIARVLPTDREYTLKIDTKIGACFTPGEILFIGFDQPTYDLEAMNKKQAEVVGKIADHVAVTGAALWLPDIVLLGLINFEEDGDAVVRRTTESWHTKNPFLQSLLRKTQIKVGEVFGKVQLRKAQIEVGQLYREEQPLRVIRTSDAIFYPSRSFAALAAELQDYRDDDSSRPKPNFPQGPYGALIHMDREYFRLAAGGHEESALRQLSAKVAPLYNFTTGLLA